MTQEPGLDEPMDEPVHNASTADGAQNLVVWTHTTRLDDLDQAGRLEKNVVRGID